MKKPLKLSTVIVWVLFILNSFLTIYAFIRSIEDFSGGNIQEATGTFLKYFSGFVLFALLDAGLFLETGLFGIKYKVPLLKSDKKAPHVVFWIVLCLISGIVSASIDSAAKSYRLSTASNPKPSIAVTETAEPVPSTTTMPTQAPEQSKAPTDFSWYSVAQNKENYLQILKYLGQNFRSETYSDEAIEAFGTNEAALIRELYKEYLSQGTLNEDFQNVFTDNILDSEYHNMYTEGEAGYSLYAQLSNSFVISWKYSDKKEEYYISVPTYDESDLYTEDGVTYLKADRYAGTGSALFTEIDGKLKEVGVIDEVCYGAYVDEVKYAFGVQATLDDGYAYENYGYEDGRNQWYDGESFLSGKTIQYYVLKTDPNRNLRKDTTDYSQIIKWMGLGYISRKDLIGKSVYMGAGNTKRYMFMITNVDGDNLIVQYPSGNKEVKDLSSIWFNQSLFVIL